MVKRLLSATLFVGFALFPVACDKIPVLGGSTGTGVASTPEAPPPPVVIGEPLFTPEDPPKSPRANVANVNDPVVIPGAQVTIPSTENVPTKNNGKLWQICTDWTPGTPEKDTFIHPNDPNKKYRRLREGDIVQGGQLVALLDDKVARAKYNAAATDVVAAAEKMAASNTVADKAKATFDVYVRLSKTPAGGESGATSKIELYKAEQEWASAVKSAAEAKGEHEKNKEAMNIARVQLEEHELRATISGKIKTLYRKPGEAVKELEPVLQIQNLNTLRVEGMLPVHYLPYLPNALGMQVYLEPSSQLAPKQELSGHGLAITGVAVSRDARKPMIVSASEDRTVRVWDQATKFQKASFLHDLPVRAIATTGPKAPQDMNLALSGSDDGYGRIYDLDNLTGDKAMSKLKAQHKGRINAVAFSPDGSSCATADDKEIFVWDTKTLERRYAINAEHRGPISQIQFTPQSTLLSTARDRTIRVWELGQKGAKLLSTIDNRAGTVDFLGVSSDGQKVIFDTPRSLQVRNIADGRTEAVMNNSSDSSQFNGFAVFSPDASLVVASGTGDNQLSVWKLPGPGSTRAYERVRLAVGNSVPTCAAFASDGAFAVVGTADHRLLVFARPEKTDLDRQYPATVRLIDPSLDSNEQKVRFWAELDNPGMPLLPGGTVTIVVPVQ